MTTTIACPAATRNSAESDTESVVVGDVAGVATSAEARFAISVVIPVRNDPQNLELCLRALEASSAVDFEVIVVDDASTDDTAEVARRHGLRPVRLETRAGPAAARNRGAHAARHPYLFFVDADVCVQPETLEQVADKFRADPSLDAFFGSYDASPGAPGFLSQYRNLLHHYVHQDGQKESSSFWSGCGAIKRSVFFELGGFDAGYANASVEDIELGSRLRHGGHRVELVKSLQVKHMKRWTLWRMIRTDVQHRAIPWTLLLLRQGEIPDDLNLRRGQRLSALLAAGLVLSLMVGVWDPGSVRIWLPMAVACLLGIVVLNRGFYGFLARAKHPLFVLRALPLHVLYYLYSSLAFAVGLVLHWRLARRRRPAAEAR